MSTEPNEGRIQSPTYRPVKVHKKSVPEEGCVKSFKFPWAERELGPMNDDGLLNVQVSCLHAGSWLWCSVASQSNSNSSDADLPLMQKPHGRCEYK